MSKVADVIVYDLIYSTHYVLGDRVEVSVNFGQHEFGHGRIGNLKLTCALMITVFSTFAIVFDRRVDVLI